MKNKSHICLLTSGRIFESLFGEVRTTFDLGRWLSKNNQNVIVMGSGFAGVKAKYISKFESKDPTIKQKKSIRVINPPYVIYMLSRLLFSFLWILKILFMNISTPIKLIHAQDTGYAGLAAIFAGKILRIPVLITSHGIRHKTISSKFSGTPSKIFLKFEYNLDIFTIKNADFIIVTNPYIKEYFEKIIAKKIEFIPGSIKSENFAFSQKHRDEIRNELGIQTNTNVVGFIGRLAPEKNLFNLISSFAEAQKNHQNLLLILVGAGMLEAKLKRFVLQKGIEDKVKFCGMRNDIQKVLSSLDIFVLPSFTEGLSVALLEAMTCERAIICSNIPANQQLVIHQKEGLLINPNSIQELKKAILQLSMDESYRREIGKNAKTKAIQYDEELIFPKILQQYNSLTQVFS